MDDEFLSDDDFSISEDQDTPELCDTCESIARDMDICDEGSPNIILMSEEDDNLHNPCYYATDRRHDSTEATHDIPSNGLDKRGSTITMDFDGSEDDTLVDEEQDCGSDAESEVFKRRPEIMGKLEGMCLSVLEQLVEALDEDDGVKPSKKSKKVVVELADRRRTCSNGSSATRMLMFPRKSKGASIQPIAQLFRVISLIHEALACNIPMTKRDMYYKDVELFKSQSVVDRLVDDLAATLGVGRADLHIRASAKGLICGSGLAIHFHGGDSVKATDSEGILIPPPEDIARFEVNESLAWVLLVEKEAVFQTTCRLKLASHPAFPGPGLIITGKGYPDLATRQLVKTLSDNLPSYIPILALVDGDAFGLDILSVYRFGSTQMQHERENLAAARVRWLGIYTSELAGLGICKDALMPVTKHDEKKALSMLRRSGLPKKWRKELQYMVHNRRKAEIEILSSTLRKATACASDRDLGRRSSDSLDSTDYVDLATTYMHTQPPCLTTYLAHKITSIVNSYAARYSSPVDTPAFPDSSATHI